MKGIISVVVLAGVAAVLWKLPMVSDWFSPGEHRMLAEVPLRGEFPGDTTGLPEAKLPQVVWLSSGETYELPVIPVKKQIGDTWVRMLSYGGSIPGPTFRVRQGDSATIRIVNRGDGDTTLHSHGLRLENAFDGVPDMTQPPIRVGDSFEYRLLFPDPGAYWYHPHVRTDYALESGLAGTYIVEPKDGQYWNPVDREEVLVLDDIALSGGERESFRRERVDHALMGRYGDTMLTNGSSSFSSSFRQGEVVRFFLVNAANARPFRVAIPKANMKLVGADMGRFEQESFVDAVTIGPGERRVIEVSFDRAGTYELKHEGPERQYVLGKFSVEPGSAVPAAHFSELRADDALGTEFSDIVSKRSGNTEKRLRLSVDMGGGMMGGHRMHMMPDGAMMRNDGMPMHQSGDGIEWEDTMEMMNRVSTSETVAWRIVDTGTGKENMDIDSWDFRRGDFVNVRIENDATSMHPMQHPIHFHGQRFFVAKKNGKSVENRVWQDTALIPAGETWDLIVEMSNPGDWMAHCHIAEHAEAGMMFPFRVR